MKKSLSINIEGSVFQIDEDAYQALDKYLSSIKKHYSNSKSGEEILKDIESGIAEKFLVKAAGKKKIINLKDVVAVIKVMGTVEQFSSELDSESPTTETKKEASNSKPRQLYRNPDDAIIAGVCSGLAAYFGIDPLYVRLAFILSIFINGIGIIAYLILWLIMPSAETGSQKLAMRGKPVNLKKIEEAVKEKSKSLKASGQEALQNINKGVLYKILNFPVKIIAAIFRFLKNVFKKAGPALSIFFGVIFVITAFVTITAVIIAIGVAIFNINSPYIYSDLPLQELAASPLYYLGMVSAMFVILVPLIFIYLFGLTMVKRKNCFRALTSGLLASLWIISITGLIIAAGDLSPTIYESVVKINDRDRVTHEFDYQNFTKLYVGGNINLKVERGNQYKIVISGRQSDLDLLNFNLEDSQLQIVQKKPGEKGKWCMFCFTKNLSATVTMPELDSLVAFRQTAVTLNDFVDDLYISLGESAEMKLDGSGQNLECRLSGIGSELKLENNFNNINCYLDGYAKLDGQELEINSLTLEQKTFSKTYLTGVADSLAINLYDYSRFYGANLIAQESAIVAGNHSHAETLPILKGAFVAKDYSDIIYYNQPGEISSEADKYSEIEYEQKLNAEDLL